MRHSIALCFCLLPFAGSVPADEPRGLELVDGDRVVFVGNTFIERDQAYGYLETMLTARWPDRNITFRNLGWSGDTVWGEARAGFDSPAEGFKRLVDQVSAAKPTVIFVGYGMNESYEGEPGLRRFLDGLERLLNEFGKTGARIILLSPMRHEDLGSHSPTVNAHNDALLKYVEAMEVFCNIRNLTFVDLFTNTTEQVRRSRMRQRTENGIHLSELGYWKVGWEILRALQIYWYHSSQQVGRCEGVTLDSFSDVRIDEFNQTETGFRFEATHELLTTDPPVYKDFPNMRFERCFQVRGLPIGSYDFFVDGKLASKNKLKGGSGGVLPLVLTDDPDLPQTEQLRRTIIEKNRLYFHRWRPQNETYLFGFRKHEQGQNAAEVPKFDPLVEELEAKIAKLRVPVKHTYELIRQD